jgi:Family of unknown function (DUF5681)
MPWKAGQSGNPAGRPAGKQFGQTFAEQARDHAPKALKRLVKIMNDERAPLPSVVAACKEIIDRVYGKPAQFSTGSQQEFRRAMEMSDDELARIIQSGPPLLELIVDNPEKGNGQTS